jgi:hypothetical protein
MQRIAAVLRKEDTRLPEKGSSNSHGVRPVYQNHFDDEVDSDQKVVDEELSLLSLSSNLEHKDSHVQILDMTFR